MKIYTKTGDYGETGLANGERVSKTSARICAIGEIDELNSLLGVVRAVGAGKMDALFKKIQNELFVFGALLANPHADSQSSRLKINEQNVLFLESAIGVLAADLKPLTQFILPAGTCLATALHQCRSVCRRVERTVVALVCEENGKKEKDSPDKNFLKYLNRLSDLFFIAARVANKQAGTNDVFWEKG